MALTPPDTEAEAFKLLINECPAFEAAWIDLKEWTSTVDLYTVFTHILLPFLHYALEDGYDRRHLKDEVYWQNIPSAPSSELDDLLGYLYDVIELWASSPVDDIRHAVYIELAEQGSGDMSVDDLTRVGGPALRRIVTVGNWSLPESQ